jgi:hypothetical protein
MHPISGGDDALFTKGHDGTKLAHSGVDEQVPACGSQKLALRDACPILQNQHWTAAGSPRDNKTTQVCSHRTGLSGV